MLPGDLWFSGLASHLVGVPSPDLLKLILGDEADLVEEAALLGKGVDLPGEEVDLLGEGVDLPGE